MQNRELKVLIHASTWFAPVLIPLIVFFASKEKEIKRLSLQALIFHLLISVLISISYFLTLTIILAIVGIPLLLGFGLIAFIVPILGIINAIQGRYFEYPIIGSFIK